MSFPSAEVINLLLKPPESRSNEDIQTLIASTRYVNFFKNCDKKALNDIWQVMQLRKYKTNEVIFEYGEVGTTFCIILKGAVSVHVPSTNWEQTQEGEVALLHNVATLKPGQSFGELSLIQDAPRIATIQWQKETWTAVLYKDDYVRILGKEDKLHLDRKVDFLACVYIFTEWTRTALNRVSYYFKERIYHNKQILFSEGDEWKEIFIVWEGEFELSVKNSFKTHKTEVRWPRNRSISPMMSKQKQNIIIRKTKTSQTSIPVSKKGPKQIIGEDDVIANRKRSTTCTCVSNNSKVLVITRKDFLRRLNVNNTWTILNSKKQISEHWSSNRITKLREYEPVKQGVTQDPRARSYSPTPPQGELRLAKDCRFFNPNRHIKKRFVRLRSPHTRSNSSKDTPAKPHVRSISARDIQAKDTKVFITRVESLM